MTKCTRERKRGIQLQHLLKDFVLICMLFGLNVCPFAWILSFTLCTYLIVKHLFGLKFKSFFFTRRLRFPFGLVYFSSSFPPNLWHQETPWLGIDQIYFEKFTSGRFFFFFCGRIKWNFRQKRAKITLPIYFRFARDESE